MQRAVARPPSPHSPVFKVVEDHGPKQPSGVAAASAYVAELLGTFLLVFAVGSLGAISAIVGEPASKVWNPTAIGFLFMALIYAFWPVSQAHLNPAVSISLALSGKCSARRAVGYIVMQVIGGLLGGVAYYLLFHFSVPMRPNEDLGFDWWEAAIVEVTYTAMLCFVALNVAFSRRNNPVGYPTCDPNQFFALAIGLVIIAGGHAAGDISGGFFNPALSIGLAIGPDFLGSLGWTLEYCAYQFLGACLASALFRVVRAEDFGVEVFPSYRPPNHARLLSEFLGTFVLVLTVGLNLVLSSKVTPWAAAAALTCMVYALGDVSGACFNPAVTLSVTLSRRGKLSLCDCLTYMLTQMSAGCLAGLLCAGVHAGMTKSAKEAQSDVVLGPVGDYSWGAVFLCEAFFTGVLAFVVLAVATTEHTATPSSTKNDFPFGFAIGSCVTAGGFAIGPISGGCLNPAVALGISMLSLVGYGQAESQTPFINFLWYGLYELVGGLVAAIIFYFTHPKEFQHHHALRL